MIYGRKKKKKKRKRTLKSSEELLKFSVESNPEIALLILPLEMKQMNKMHQGKRDS